MNKIEYIKRYTDEILVEKVCAEKSLKFFYHNPFGRISLNTLVKRKFLTAIYGKYMSSTASKRKIKKFVADFDINMNESAKTIEEFTNFNDFFYRELKKGARDIDYSIDSIISPADGKILVYNNISDINNLFVKGKRFELNEFLKDNKLAQEYKNGALAIVRLAPQNYHRVHFPCDGYITNTRLINGYYYSVNPYAIKSNIDVFLENKREISILKTNSINDILIIEVGATMVGGIKQIYTPFSNIKKADYKSYFHFGGSTVILIFKENTIKFDDDLINNTNKKLETEIFMGQRIATKKIWS